MYYKSAYRYILPLCANFTPHFTTYRYLYYSKNS